MHISIRSDSDCLSSITAISGDASKLLLAAKRIKKATKIDFFISLAANDFSQTSDNYAGKLRYLLESCFLLSLYYIVLV